MKLWLRGVAMGTLVCFLATQTVSAAPGASIDIAGGRERPSFLSLDIPAELASIDELYEATGQADPKFILHIQDAHANYEAQTKIKQLLAYLKKTYAINTVFVEGASGKLDADYIRLFQDDANNLKLGEVLAKQGELSGTELYLLQAGNDFEALGIEDPSLYKENYAALKTIFNASGDVDRFFKGFDGKLGQVSSKVFSPDVRVLLADWKNFEKGRRDFLPFVKSLVKKAKTVLREDLESLFAQVGWPQISRLLVIQTMEKDLNRVQALAERDALVKFLREKNVSKALIDSTSRFQEGNISIGRFEPGKNAEEIQPRYLLEQLVAEAGPKGFRFSDYPNFSLYAGYVVLKGELDAKALFEEIEYLFTKMLDMQVQEASQKKLLELYRDGELLRKLLYLELDRAGWRKVQERRSVLGIDPMVARLKEMVALAKGEVGGEDRQVMSPEFSRKMTELMATGFKFYNFACQREEVFFAQMRKAMAERNIRKAVVITGGFHTNGLSDLFRENDTSYGIVTPHLSEKSNEKLYATSMLQNRDYPFTVSYIPPASNEMSIGMQEAMGVRSELRIATKLFAFMDMIGLDVRAAAEQINSSRFARKSGIQLVVSEENDARGRPVVRVVRTQAASKTTVGPVTFEAGPILPPAPVVLHVQAEGPGVRQPLAKPTIKNILVVDDEEMGRGVAKIILQEKGFVVEEAKSGEDALAKLDGFQPDAILTDILMPGKKGYEWVREAALRDGLRQVPVVFMSGDVGDVAAFDKAFNELAENHPVSFVYKPLNMTELAGLFQDPVKNFQRWPIRSELRRTRPRSVAVTAFRLLFIAGVGSIAYAWISASKLQGQEEKILRGLAQLEATSVPAQLATPGNELAYTIDPGTGFPEFSAKYNVKPVIANEATKKKARAEKWDEKRMFFGGDEVAVERVSLMDRFVMANRQALMNKLPPDVQAFIQYVEVSGKDRVSRPVVLQVAILEIAYRMPQIFQSLKNGNVRLLASQYAPGKSASILGSRFWGWGGKDRAIIFYDASITSPTILALYLAHEAGHKAVMPGNVWNFLVWAHAQIFNLGKTMPSNEREIFSGIERSFAGKLLAITPSYGKTFGDEGTLESLYKAKAEQLGANGVIALIADGLFLILLTVGYRAALKEEKARSGRQSGWKKPSGGSMMLTAKGLRSLASPDSFTGGWTVVFDFPRVKDGSEAAFNTWLPDFEGKLKAKPGSEDAYGLLMTLKQNAMRLMVNGPTLSEKIDEFVRYRRGEAEGNVDRMLQVVDYLKSATPVRSEVRAEEGQRRMWSRRDFVTTAFVAAGFVALTGCGRGRLVPAQGPGVQPATGKSLLEDALRQIGEFRKIATNPVSGLTYDGQPLDFMTGKPVGGVRNWSAASKEALDVSLLALAVWDKDPKARLVIDPEHPENATRQAVAALEKKISSYERFAKEYPGFGGFLPWFLASDTGLEPTSDWQDRVPALDNGELAWALRAAASALKQKGYGELADRYLAYFRLMATNARMVFYEPGGAVRGEASLRDAQAAPKAANYFNKKPDYFLNDPYEGEMMTVFMDLYGGFSGAEKEALWQRKRGQLKAVEYQTPQGPITVERAWMGSQHETWKFWELPYDLSPTAKTLFVNGQKARTWESSAKGIPGLFASAHVPVSAPGTELRYEGAYGVPSIAGQRGVSQGAVAPYAVVSVFIAGGVGIGEAWLRTMAEMPRVMTGKGFVDAVSADGTAYAPILTWDGNAPIALGILGGISKLNQAALEEDGLLGDFTRRVEAEYQKAFPVIHGQQLPFGTPPSTIGAAATPVPVIAADDLELEYQGVAETGDVEKMKVFIRKVVKSMDLEITNEGGLSGFAPFYTAYVPGVKHFEFGKGVQSLERMKAELLDARGRWTKDARPGGRSEMRAWADASEWEQFKRDHDVAFQAMTRLGYSIDLRFSEGKFAELVLQKLNADKTVAGDPMSQIFSVGSNAYTKSIVGIIKRFVVRYDRGKDEVRFAHDLRDFFNGAARMYLKMPGAREKLKKPLKGALNLLSGTPSPGLTELFLMIRGLDALELNEEGVVGDIADRTMELLEGEKKITGSEIERVLLDVLAVLNLTINPRDVALTKKDYPLFVGDVTRSLGMSEVATPLGMEEGAFRKWIQQVYDSVSGVKADPFKKHLLDYIAAVRFAPARELKEKRKNKIEGKLLGHNFERIKSALEGGRIIEKGLVEAVDQEDKNIKHSFHVLDEWWGVVVDEIVSDPKLGTANKTTEFSNTEEAREIRQLAGFNPDFFQVDYRKLKIILVVMKGKLQNRTGDLTYEFSTPEPRTGSRIWTHKLTWKGRAVSTEESIDHMASPTFELKEQVMLRLFLVASHLLEQSRQEEASLLINDIGEIIEPYKSVGADNSDAAAKALREAVGRLVRSYGHVTMGISRLSLSRSETRAVPPGQPELHFQDPSEIRRKELTEKIDQLELDRYAAEKEGDRYDEIYNNSGGRGSTVERDAAYAREVELSKQLAIAKAELAKLSPAPVNGVSAGNRSEVRRMQAGVNVMDAAGVQGLAEQLGRDLAQLPLGANEIKPAVRTEDASLVITLPGKPGNRVEMVISKVYGVEITKVKGDGTKGEDYNFEIDHSEKGKRRSEMRPFVLPDEVIQAIHEHGPLGLPAPKSEDFSAKSREEKINGYKSKLGFSPWVNGKPDPENEDAVAGLRTLRYEPESTIDRITWLFATDTEGYPQVKNFIGNATLTPTENEYLWTQAKLVKETFIGRGQGDLGNRVYQEFLQESDRRAKRSEMRGKTLVAERQQLAEEAVAMFREQNDEETLNALQSLRPEFKADTPDGIVFKVIVRAKGVLSVEEVVAALKTLVALNRGDMDWKAFLALARTVLEKPILAVSEAKGATIAGLRKVPTYDELESTTLQLGLNTGQLFRYVLEDISASEQANLRAEVRDLQKNQDVKGNLIGDRLEIVFAKRGKLAEVVKTAAVQMGEVDPTFKGGAHLTLLVPENEVRQAYQNTIGTVMESLQDNLDNAPVRNLLAMKAAQMDLSLKDADAKVALLNKQIQDIKAVTRNGNYFQINGTLLGAVAKLWAEVMSIKATSVAA